MNDNKIVLSKELVLQYQNSDLKLSLIEEKIGRLEDAKTILVEEHNKIVEAVNKVLAEKNLAINLVSINMRTGEVVPNNS